MLHTTAVYAFHWLIRFQLSFSETGSITSLRLQMRSPNKVCGKQLHIKIKQLDDYC